MSGLKWWTINYTLQKITANTLVVITAYQFDTWKPSGTKKIVKSQELQYANEIFVKIAKLLEALVAHMGIPRLLSKPDKTWSLTVEGTQHVAVGSFSSS